MDFLPVKKGDETRGGQYFKIKKMGYSFLNDYGEGCFPGILDVLGKSNFSQEIGYGEDTLCFEAISLIKEGDRSF